jgi:hypothetical protein
MADRETLVVPRRANPHAAGRFVTTRQTVLATTPGWTAGVVFEILHEEGTR